MAHRSMFDPDPVNPHVPKGQGRVENGALPPEMSMRSGFDVTELAARFSAHGGGRVTPEVSADLALEIVLNGIVEQACLATPATGAAIVLRRAGEWVCRASAGGSAPSLGARLNTEAGLSGACIRTWQMQRCDDAQSDPRADIEASRDLGVRSVMILPLLQNNELVGLFEVFSPSASVFGERDERTLDALSRLALANLQRASEPPALAGKENALATDRAAGNYTGRNEQPSSSSEYSSGAIVPPTVNENFSARSINVLTWFMGSLVFAAAGLLVVMVSGRLGAGTFAARAHASSTVSAPLSRASNQAIGAGNSPEETAGTTAKRAKANETSRARPSEFTGAAPASGDARARGQSPPAGSLLVYQDGKEIFRLPPAVENNVAGNQAQPNQSPATGEIGAGRQSGPGIEAAAIYEISPEVAEGSLLRRVEPDYPEQARQKQIQGPVVLDVRAGRDGSIQEIKLLSGQPLLADAAMAAVKQWRFRPLKIKGQPVEMETKVTLNFKLPQ